MKILIQHRHLKHEIAGVLTYIDAITPELEQRGVTVQTVSTRADKIHQWVKLIAGADIIHMNSNDLLFALLCKLFNKKIIIKYHYCFYQSIHSHYEQMTFVQRLKTEFYHTLPKANYPLKWKLFTLVKWARLATRITTALVADSHTACSNFLGESCAFPWKVATLYNPIAVRSPIQQKQLNTLANPDKFVFVGRLDKDKGVDILLQAASILKKENRQFQIEIIGDGPKAAELKQLTSDLELTNCVTFLGKLPNSEVIVKLQDALALVAPSRWQDPAPYVVLEAASTQTCAIVSQMGGLPEMAGSQGFFFENEDFRGLATCMRYCLEHPEEVIQRGVMASQYVAEKFSAHSAATQLLDICQQLIPMDSSQLANAQLR
ncbi:glycosyltransferase [Nostoc sp. CENA543]|uniref:glycosyltransferase family 4 protein n=1 Tax=Nostoc sp. CENA543 TaxID=1869241 RepID=UPI000CA2F51C|nr:glycosyltransferase [Nostoc sp. CENA543]AUS99325.1 glycosyltransferase [Nostoc sp. CENA543]